MFFFAPLRAEGAQGRKEKALTAADRSDRSRAEFYNHRMFRPSERLPLVSTLFRRPTDGRLKGGITRSTVGSWPALLSPLTRAQPALSSARRCSSPSCCSHTCQVWRTASSGQYPAARQPLFYCPQSVPSLARCIRVPYQP